MHFILFGNNMIGHNTKQNMGAVIATIVFLPRKWNFSKISKDTKLDTGNKKAAAWYIVTNGSL